MSATLSPVRQELAELCAAILPGLHGAPGGRAHTISPELWAALTDFVPPQPGSFAGFRLPTPGPGVTRRSFLDLIPVVPAANALYVPELTIQPSPGSTRPVGGLKAEQALLLDGTNELLRSVASLMSVTDELLDDVPQLEAWIKTWLRFLNTLTEEYQVLNGDATANGVNGFLRRADIVEGGSGATRTEVIASAYHEILASTGFMPDGLVIDFLGSLLIEDTIEWVEGVPWMFGMRVYSSPNMNAGLIGCFGVGAVIGRDGPPTVEGTNSHDVNFTKNLSAIRVESRLALGVISPQLFRSLAYPTTP